jgi:type IV pilus assembly protein PilZ
MAIEDRRAKRADLSIPVSSQKLTRNDTITNLSTHGAFIRTRKPLKIGEDVPLKFSLPHNQSVIEVASLVVWSRLEGDNPGMGVEFLGLSEDIFDRLLGFIEELYG